jgi:hypothetical protein
MRHSTSRPQRARGCGGFEARCGGWITPAQQETRRRTTRRAEFLIDLKEKMCLECPRVCSCLALACLVLLLGCVPNRAYRVGAGKNQLPAVVCREDTESRTKYDIAYIEFDDMGEYWTIGQLGRHDKATSQLEDAIALIKKRKETAPVAVVAFIHGWKNNASAYDERQKHQKNLAGFKMTLEQLAEKDPGHAYIGIFLSWRGQSIPGDLFVSYWNRREAARRVGGASMTEALFNLMFATKAPIAPSQADKCGAFRALDVRGSYPPARDVFVLIGHSFGVRILERAISQPLMALLYERASEAESCRIAYNADPKNERLNVLTFESPADLIVTINAANDAFEAKAMIEGMQRMNLRTCSGDTCEATGDFFDSAPIIVSILSEGDWITRKLMPFAQAISYPSQNLNRAYDVDAANEGQLVNAKQHSFFLHNEGSIQQLVSHTVSQCKKDTCSQCPGALVFSVKPESYQLVPVRMNPTSCKKLSQAELDAGGGKKGDAAEGRFINKTPFWVFMVPRGVIPNHSNFFTPETSALLQGILLGEIASGGKSMSASLLNGVRPAER